MNSPNVPEWMGKSSRKVYCDPPDLNFRVYQAPVEENEESGGCAPVLIGGIAICVACVFGMSRESSAGVGQSIVTESIVQSKTDLLSTFISTHFKTAQIVGQKHGIPVAVLLAEAYLVTGGKNPKGNNFFGEGSFKNPYRSFLAHANRCSDRLDGVVYDEPVEYVDAAVSAKIYLDGAGQSVKNLIPKIQNLIK